MDRVRLVHLEGPERGHSVVLPRLPATLGSDEDSDVVMPGIAPRHAVLFRRGREVVLLDSGSAQGTRLSGETVDEAVLHEGDVMELGSGGPRLEFHDEGHLGRAARRAPELPGTMAFRLAGRTSPAFRVAVALAVLAGAALVFWSWREGRKVRSEMADLRQALTQGEQDRRALEQRVGAERGRAFQEGQTLQQKVDDFRGREEELTQRLAAAAPTGDVETLKGELATTRDRLATLETEREVGEHIIRDYGSGVCLIQGSYAFYDKTGRPLRYAPGTPPPGQDETALQTEGDGDVHTVDYYGTGFLVDKSGLVLTNRHVAEPWWNDATADAMRQKGYEPRFVLLRAFFPREKTAVDLTFQRRSEKADLALLHAQMSGRKIPVLPLEREAQRAVPGQPVVVLGYPTGLEAILAKTESGVVASILESHGTDSERVTEALSQRGLIRPSATQGHIGDVTGSDIVFDAPTSQGGSGGPVFNKHGQVIAVEYALLPKFGGNSFGVPISYAIALLQKGR